MIEAVKTVTEIECIDWWWSCLSASLFQLLFTFQDLPPAGDSDHFALKVDWYYLAYIKKYRMYVLVYLIIKNVFHLISIFLHLHVPGWHLCCSIAKGLWLIPLPSVSLPRLWWHSDAPVTHSHINFTATHTHTIKAPHPGCLLFCLSITWCKLDLMNVREELRQTQSCRYLCWLWLFITFILDGWGLNPLNCL